MLTLIKTRVRELIIEVREEKWNLLTLIEKRMRQLIMEVREEKRISNPMEI